MASANKFMNLENCTIRFRTPEGEYEGNVLKVVPAAETVIVGKIILLPDRRMGTLNFIFKELSNIRVISRPDKPQDISIVKKDILPVYPKTAVEKLFDLDGSSDIEDDESTDNLAAYKIKLVPHLSNSVPIDFAVIDSFDKDFNLAIKHIKEQDAIGVSLEGVKISRSGTLTWLCVSTPCCNFLFDILALGEQAFVKGLKSILENARIQKILHDCRLASDCLYHKYGVRLVNVFDTQIADYIVMMQMSEKEKITNRVNGLDACLHYYLEVPCDYLYGPAKFSSNEDNLNFYALRPLQHEIQDVLIKNIMYLHLLKRELELALLTPLRRTTEIYLNCVQKLDKKELLVVQHKPDELPPDIHLEGIQIFRYQEFEYMCSIAASGPPYREIENPIQNYINYRAKYKNGQKEDKESIVNKHAVQISGVTSSELNQKADGNHQKYCKSSSELKLDVNSSDSLSESDPECSEDLEKNPSVDCKVVKHKLKSNTPFRHESNVKPEVPLLREYTVRNPVMLGMLELLSKTSRETLKSVNPTSDVSRQASDYNSQISQENTVVDSESNRLSSHTNNILNFKSACNPSVRNNVSKAEKPQPPQMSRRKSPSELLELISKMRSMNPLKADTSSDENSANDSVATSASVCKKSSKDYTSKTDSIKNISNVKLVQIDDSVMKKDESLSSDSDLEEIAARVRMRGALLRNRQTPTAGSSLCDPLNIALIKPKQTSETSVSNLEPTSEDVTVYYSNVIDKPSQMVIKVKPKRSCLADLYKEAGDGNLLWNEEESESVPKSSPRQTFESSNSDSFWASVRGNPSSEPIDEKLRLRLIPAGMSGY